MLQKKFTGVLHNKGFNNTGLALFLIVLFGLLLRLVFFSGMGTSDDLAYSRYAANTGDITNPDSVLTLSTRLGIVYPTKFFYGLFGINDFSSVVFVLLISIGNIMLIFYFGKLLFNEKAGLLAAFLMSFFPLEVVYSTKLLTDLPAAFFMSLGVYLFLSSEIKSKSYINYFFSGVFIGIGYLIRESVLLIALFFIIYILYKKRIKREYFLVPLGVLLIFLIESLIFLNLAGDPLFRIHASQEYLAESVIVHDYFGRLDFPTGLFHYPYIILTSNIISFFYIFIGIAIIYSIVYRKKETYIIMFWFIALLLYLSFGSSSLAQYIPFKATPRYLSIISIPGILLLAFFLMDKNKVIRKTIMPLAVSILFLTSLFFVYLRDDRSKLADLDDAYSYLKDINNAVFTDSRSLQALDYLSGYKNELDIREYPSDFSSVNNAYILLNRAMVKGLREANPSRVFPKEIDSPPDDWAVIMEAGEGEDRITVYYKQ